MANETCPHCGAERRYEERYDCGTWVAQVVLSDGCRSHECYERQLAAVTAEAKRLSESDDKITNICLGVDCDGDTTADAVAAMAAKLAEVTAERDVIARRIAEAPVGYAPVFENEQEDWDASSIETEATAQRMGLHKGRWVRVRLVRDDAADKSP